MVKCCNNCKHISVMTDVIPCKECFLKDKWPLWEAAPISELKNIINKFYRLPIVDGMVTIPAADYKMVLEYLEEKL